MNHLDILKRYWNYESFRGIQLDIIESISRGNDTLGLMPTGGGKSITFQVPALSMEGVCIVITPLIALMKDQVRNLKRRNIKATAIYTGMGREEILAAMDNCQFGEYKFLYISPERLSSQLFLSRLKFLKVSMIAVDESHCISQWGFDFRPAYLEIINIRTLLPGVPILALTATATPKVAENIESVLGFKRSNIFKMSFFRENLSYVVRDTENKLDELQHILSRISGSGIVYVRNRRKSKEVATFLNSVGISATYYHAGLDTNIKDKYQQEWTEDRCRIVVATNAFGMGIDKPDVRVVIHLDMPDSIEAYYQEAGRAGRDGKRSYAILLHSPGDERIINKRISDNFPSREFIVGVYEKLAYFYQMAVGDGEGCSYSFSLSEFCQNFSLPIIPCESALRILTRNGYIEYIDETDYSARLHIIASRDDLYNYKASNKINEQILNTILRYYSGIFADYVFIDEKYIASTIGVKSSELYHHLVNMQHDGILHYIPSRRTPVIKWRVNRIATDRVHLSEETFTARRQEFEERISSIRHYATAKVGCRSRILLNYFGERRDRPCMHCDLCLQRDSNGLQRGAMERIAVEIRALQENGYIDGVKIERLPYEKREIAMVLERMVNEGELSMLDGAIKLLSV